MCVCCATILLSTLLYILFSTAMRLVNKLKVKQKHQPTLYECVCAGARVFAFKTKSVLQVPNELNARKRNHSPDSCDSLVFSGRIHYYITFL